MLGEDCEPKCYLWHGHAFNGNRFYWIKKIMMIIIIMEKIKKKKKTVLISSFSEFVICDCLAGSPPSS